MDDNVKVVDQLNAIQINNKGQSYYQQTYTVYSNKVIKVTNGIEMRLNPSSWIDVNYDFKFGQTTCT